ncbi:MAG: DNA-binding protein Alba [archaeon]|nr:DNA-binding protein Alba [archaeon]MCP8316416.1 DNA-binding protein Alba [archaeon]MCP8321765.1 DNA-binding protein Alba [archaeon]
MPEINSVFIGKKPVMNYVLACLTLFQNGSDPVIIKARGRAISKAVDVAQIAVKRFATGINVKKINIDTEQVKSSETGNMNNVSSIEIYLGK